SSGKFVLYRVSELDVSNRIWLLFDLARDPFIPFATLADRPFRRFISTDLLLPFRAYFCKIVCENVGRTATVRSMYDSNVCRGKVHTRIVLLDIRVVPLLYLTQKNVGNDLWRKSERLGDGGNVVSNHHCTEHRRNVQNLGG